MELRWPARLWAGLAAVVGGHITGRMDLAGVSLVLSTASASLALAAMLDLGLTGRRKSALLLGSLGAVTLVSGQGYLQVALLGWAPFVFLFLLRGRSRPPSLLREYTLALIFALTLAGVFLVPSLHFRPNIHKDFDLLFETGQPLEYLPLNLVIRDVEFMRTALLGKLPIPHLSNLYIGWVPILLVGLALLLRRPADWRALAFLLGGSAASFVLASGLPFRWLVAYAPWLGIVRHVSLLAGLAVPGILAIAAYGLDAFLRLPLMTYRVSPFRSPGLRRFMPTAAFLVVIPLAMGLRASFDFARTWLATGPTGWAYDVASGWRTPSLEWLQPPYGDHYWLEVSLGEGLKVSTAWYPWTWAGRTAAAPRIEVTWSDPSEGAVFLHEREGMATYLHPDRHYAFILAGAELIPCAATGGAGDIRVRCSSGREGLLIVQENSWEGWRVWIDSGPVPLVLGTRLAVQSLPGTHEYRFRYLPWDVPLGLALTMMGSAATIILYVRADKAARRGSIGKGRG
jgi:hypothetical protein